MLCYAFRLAEKHASENLSFFDDMEIKTLENKRQVGYSDYFQNKEKITLLTSDLYIITVIPILITIHILQVYSANAGGYK